MVTIGSTVFPINTYGGNSYAYANGFPLVR